VDRAQWAEALAAFEQAAKLKPHAVTTYNIAACERAMGRYTRARRMFLRALQQHQGSQGRELPGSLVEEAQGRVGEIDRLLVRAQVAVKPAGTTFTVDGRPIQVLPASRGEPTYVSNTAVPGPGAPAPGRSFVLLLDPGLHIFLFSRPGYSDALVKRTFAAGSRPVLDISLDRLPATLRVSADQEGAIVLVNQADLGPVPLDLVRPPGTYRVQVRKPGFLSYETLVVARPGQEMSLRARLSPRPPSVFRRWWFWGAAGVAVAGAALATYLATRPEPTRPEVSGGTLGWKVHLP
jgi:hypothetical protein